MSFGEALKILNIEDYAERIYDSNSCGELGHCLDFIAIADFYSKNKLDISWFRPTFIYCVNFAEKSWSRPASCFQHIPRMIDSLIESIKNNK